MSMDAELYARVRKLEKQVEELLKRHPDVQAVLERGTAAMTVQKTDASVDAVETVYGSGYCHPEPDDSDEQLREMCEQARETIRDLREMRQKLVLPGGTVTIGGSQADHAPTDNRHIISGTVVEFLPDGAVTIEIGGTSYTGPMIRFYAPEGVKGNLWADIEHDAP